MIFGLAGTFKQELNAIRVIGHLPPGAATEDYGLTRRACDRCGFIRQLPRGPLRICDPCNVEMGMPTHAQRRHDAQMRAIIQDAQKPTKVFYNPPSLKVRVMMAWFRLARRRGLA